MILNKIYHGDCLSILKSWPDKCFDFCFTDPPYNVSKDYGVCKDNMPEPEYLDWSAQVVSEIKRVAVQACVYIPQKYALHYWNRLGQDYRQIILSYSPSGAIRYGFSNQFSFLLTNAKPNRACVRNVWNNCQLPGLGWFFKEDNFGHPGYTSEDITGRVINIFTKKRQTILDPFMGTGTTAKMCKLLDRQWVGIENNPEYIELANRRIENTVVNGTLNL